jgi:hypothetical protein
MNMQHHPLPPASRRENIKGRLPILALLLLCLLVGLLVLPDYGASWDEPNLRLYAAAALKAYSPAARLDPAFRIEETYGPTNHRFYGPAYVMAASLLVSALRSNPFGWNADNLWHLASFLTFLASAYALWALCRRMMSPAAALAAAALYLSQPLLWGHALINPKDIPFMASFLIAITSGLAMVDQAARSASPVEQNAAKIGPNSAPLRALLLAAALCLVLFLWVTLLIQPLQILLRLAIAAAQSSPASLLGQIFYRFAASAAVIPAEDYVQKIMRWVNALRWGAGLFSFIALLLAVVIHPRSGIRAQIELLNGQAATYRSPRVLLSLFLAALALGLSTSIRLLGPLAGLFVCVVALVRLRARACRCWRHTAWPPWVCASSAGLSCGPIRLVISARPSRS